MSGFHARKNNIHYYKTLSLDFPYTQEPICITITASTDPSCLEGIRICRHPKLFDATEGRIDADL